MHVHVQALLDVLVHVVRGCRVGGDNPAPLPNAFIDQLFPNVVKRTVDSSDSTILQVRSVACIALLSVKPFFLHRMGVSVCGH